MVLSAIKDAIGSALKQTPKKAPVINMFIVIDKLFPEELGITGSSFEGSFDGVVKITKHSAFFNLDFISESFSDIPSNAVFISSKRGAYEEAKRLDFSSSLDVVVKIKGHRRSGKATFRPGEGA